MTMPAPLVAALAAPIREVAALVGPGGAEPVTAALAGARTALAVLATSGRSSWRTAAAHWSGAGADGAAAFWVAAAADVDAVAGELDRLIGITTAAADAVTRAHARLQAIVERFEARAAALAPVLDEPGTAEELIAEARHGLAEAIAVVEELRGELDRRAAAVAAPPPPPPPGPPSAVPAIPGGGSPSPAGVPGLLAAGSGLAALRRTHGSSAHHTPAARPEGARARITDPAVFGEGVAVRLPDGSTAVAPNRVAADAVRHALTQLGVPYRWGGTTPGVGLDCSGLTQWAYRQAGLELPRLAQEQDVGAPVAPDELRPGDLAVWDGHVAMVVGNGLMIEAGDPVQLSAIRTTNAGQGFQGFWRPTA